MHRAWAGGEAVTGHEGTGAIAVALSGGVDSMAAALRLREGGRRLIGLTALLADTPAAREGIARARALCSQLHVEHHLVDLRDEFQRLIIRPFARDYERGRTPNPCVRCNEHIKFGLLLQEALGVGAEALATGHYARLRRDDTGRPYLLRARDLHKDQSYVLHHLSHEQLSLAVLEHGEATRADNERLVAHSGLEVRPSAESQDICFLPDVDHGPWLRRVAPGAFEPGDIVDVDGRIVGRHAGLAGYTIGQRKGLGVGGPGGRKFVLHLDTASNRVIVGGDDDLWVRWCDVEDVNLIAPDLLTDDTNPAAPRVLECHVMTRYNGALTPATVTVQGGRAQVRFHSPTRAPTSGQSAVFYSRDRCLGSGVIDSTELTERFRSLEAHHD